MKTIAFVTQKGGSGKSTLCISLAVAARQAGASVCILDMDRQGTISDWAGTRKSRSPDVMASDAMLSDAVSPDVVSIDAAGIAAVLTKLAAGGYDYVFIDTPGAIGAETLAAIRAADLCVVPARPTPADLRAIRPTLAAIYRMEKRFTFVLNQAPSSGFRARDAAEGLTALGVLPDVNIVLRNDHQDAVGAGRGVTELNPGGKAADEIRQLWDWIAVRAGTAGARKAAVTDSRSGLRREPQPQSQVCAV